MSRRTNLARWLGELEDRCKRGLGIWPSWAGAGVWSGGESILRAKRAAVCSFYAIAHELPVRANTQRPRTPHARPESHDDEPDLLALALPPPAHGPGAEPELARSKSRVLVQCTSELAHVRCVLCGECILGPGGREACPERDASGVSTLSSTALTPVTGPAHPRPNSPPRPRPRS